MKTNVQDLSWATFGTTTYAGKHREESDIPRIGIEYLCKDFANRETSLPRHNLTPRGVFVSFGGIVYFLMALDHYAQIFADESTSTLFQQSVSRVLALQGQSGEWPWFIDSGTGSIMDWYQIYSVHQDSMAMLFLFPALRLGLHGVESSIQRSVSFLLGNNQINTSLIRIKPFFIYRSIRRKFKFLERPLRLMRAITLKSAKKSGDPANAAGLELNKECRSYHLGWILYTWVGRSDFTEFTELDTLYHRNEG